MGLLLSFDGDWLHTEEAELCCNHSLWPQTGFKNESSRWPGGPAGQLAGQRRQDRSEARIEEARARLDRESAWMASHSVWEDIVRDIGNFLDTTSLDPPLPFSKVCKTSFAQNPGRGAQWANSGVRSA